MDLELKVKQKLYRNSGLPESRFEVEHLGEDRFSIRASEAGDFMVHPQIIQKSLRRNVVISPAQLSVFKKLKADPPNLFLSSGCLGVLQISDGPFGTS